MQRQDDIDALGVYAEPQRRRLFGWLQQSGPATVTELVEALGLGRTLVAFHLGKLVDAGFVEVLAPEGAEGTTGRPAQRYVVTGQEVSASVPDRRYDLLAAVLLDAITDFRAGETAHDSALRAAHRRGVEHGRQLGRGRMGRSRAAWFSRLETLLSALGYAPRRTDDELRVRNCPFDRFRATHTELVCPLNLALAEGYLAGLQLDRHLQARLQPDPDSCCVAFSATSD
jgi:predicted ArsR family transcriptional regulator